MASVTDQFGNTQQALQELQAEFAEQSHERTDLQDQLALSKALHAELQALHKVQADEVVQLNQKLFKVQSSNRDLQVFFPRLTDSIAQMKWSQDSVQCSSNILAAILLICCILHDPSPCQSQAPRSNEQTKGCTTSCCTSRHSGVATRHLHLPIPLPLHNQQFHPCRHCYKHFVWLGPDASWHSSLFPSPLLPLTPSPPFCTMLIVSYHLWYLQVELTQKGEQLGEQTEYIAALTTQRDQLTATAQRDSSTLQSLQEEVEAKTSHVHDLEAQLAGQHKQSQSSQRQLQQQKSVQRKLASQLELQSAQLSGVSERASNLEVDKQQLQQKLDDMVCDQHQM